MIRVLLLFLLASQTALACRSAAFGRDQNRTVAKSFDFEVAGGAFFKNSADRVKSAVVLNPNNKPLKWKSKLESITFSQIGPEFPFGGMNEKGLTIEALWLAETETLKFGIEPSINESQYIQYILDQASSVEDALALTRLIRIEKAFAPIHYFICDRNNQCVVIELTKNGLKVDLAPEADSQVIENVIFASTLISRDHNPIRKSFIEHIEKNPPSVSNSFTWLQKVKTTGWSRWQIVYDIKNLQVFFRQVNPDGNVSEIQSLKFEKDKTRTAIMMADASGVRTWTKAHFENSITSFSAGFPDFKVFVPIVREYLKSQFKSVGL